MTAASAAAISSALGVLLLAAAGVLFIVAATVIPHPDGLRGFQHFVEAAGVCLVAAAFCFAYAAYRRRG